MRLCEKTFLLSCKLDFYQLELKLSKLPLLLSHFLFTTKSLNHSPGQTRMRDAESDRLLLSFGVSQESLSRGFDLSRVLSVLGYSH